MAKTKKDTVSLRNPFTDAFLPRWEEWKAFKKEQFRFTYKPIGEQSAIDELFEFSGGDENIAYLIIKQSKAKGWRGLFELKQQFNGNTTGRITEKPKPTGNVAPGGFGQL